MVQNPVKTAESFSKSCKSIGIFSKIISRAIGN